MTTTEKTFLTPLEASEISGKSEITIKRLIRNLFDQLTTNNDTESLSLIIKEKAPKGFYWKIEEDFFREKFNIEKKTEKKSPQDEIIKIFSDQLQEKDRQMREKDEQIKSLLERQREGNILTKNLQDRVLSLESGEKKSNGQEVDQSIKTTEKKGFWRKIFRK